MNHSWLVLLLIACSIGYVFGRYVTPPTIKTTYQRVETHIFDDPIMVKEGETIQLIFIEKNGDTYGQNITLPEKTTIKQLQFNVNKDEPK